MKINVKRENLLRLLQITSKLVKQRATLPVLGNVLLSSDKGRLKITSTDLEAAIISWSGAKIDEEGAITVPARTIFDYVSTDTSDTLELVSEGADLSVKGQRGHVLIKGITADEFPIIPQVKTDKRVVIKTTELKVAILSTSPAAALDETRPVLAGLLFRMDKDDLVLVATDSYRLAERRVKVEEKTELDVIVPARIVAELGRILPQDDSLVEISSEDNQVQFKFDDIEFVSRQIDGAFPDYEQIIPSEFVHEAIINKNEFMEAIKTANIFAREQGGNIKIAAGENGLVISAISSGTGDCECFVKSSSKGPPLQLAFNARYILDALAVIGGEEVILALAGEMSAGMLFDKEDGSFRYVVMPLRNE